MDPLLDAQAFKEKNPDAYRQFMLWALEDRRHGARPSIALYFELARRPWLANQLNLQPMDAQVRLNNNLRSGVARLLNKEMNLGFVTRDSWSEHLPMNYGGTE